MTIQDQEQWVQNEVKQLCDKKWVRVAQFKTVSGRVIDKWIGSLCCLITGKVESGCVLFVWGVARSGERLFVWGD